MSKADYDSQLKNINALPGDEVRRPNMPVSIALQEAEDLYEWCQEDKIKLEKAGLEWRYVEELPQRIGACRYIETQWQTEFKSTKEAQKDWRKKSREARNLRDELLHHFRHAYRKFPELLNSILQTGKSGSQASLIQSLSDLVVIGQANRPPLTKIGFDFVLLDQANLLSQEMPSLLARFNSEKLDHNAVLKTLRNRSFTYVKKAVDEIRHHGKFVFWRNKERKEGYISAFIKRKHSKEKNKKLRKKRIEATTTNSNNLN